ncbi:MAG: mechanosensitive ion channel family protein [Oscillospiraceae bacterium]|nr:mechanosensitive ion channel family protein [Oscillospiraceae bacterium]
MEKIIAFLTSLTLETIIPVIITALVGVVIIRAILKLVDRTLSRSKLDRAATGLLKSLAKVVLYVLLALMVADRMGVDVTGVVALASVASLAVSLALQDALSNVIGGFTLLTNKPFKAGDYVEIAGQGGTVQSIDIAYTKLSTPDNKLIFLPNASVVASQIVNYSTAVNRRVDITVTASYDAPIETVKQALLRAADQPQVLADPAPFAGVTNYGDSAIEYVLRFWVGNADYWDAKFAATEAISREFAASGVEMTFPHLNVHLDK